MWAIGGSLLFSAPCRRSWPPVARSAIMCPGALRRSTSSSIHSSFLQPLLSKNRPHDFFSPVAVRAGRAQASSTTAAGRVGETREGRRGRGERRREDNHHSWRVISVSGFNHVNHWVGNFSSGVRQVELLVLPGFFTNRQILGL